MKEQRPNILFIVADDLNAWIGALGRNPDVRTPSIDDLASRGTLFVNAYCAAPYCNASRMSVFTGSLPWTTGIYQNEPFWEASSRRLTYVERLRQNGYHTFGAGKVFHGVFDYRTAGQTKSSHADWVEIENRQELWNGYVPNRSEPLPSDRPVNRLVDFDRFDQLPGWYHHFDWGPLPDEAESQLPDEAVCRAVSDFLQKDPPRPFFCAAGIYKPHLPWHVPQRYFDLYDPDRLSLPLVKRNDLDDVPDIARDLALSPPDHELIESHGEWPRAVQGYLAAISYCDWIVGRIVDALDESGLADETLIVLWGDNGFHLGEKLHWRKFTLWEEATRVPLIIVHPGMAAARARVFEPVNLIDLFPTIWDLCGLEPIRAADGESLAALMAGTAARTTPSVTTWLQGNHSVRLDDWRYTRYRDGTEELYDHRTDPYEWTNLISTGRFDEVRDRLREQLRRA